MTGSHFKRFKRKLLLCCVSLKKAIYSSKTNNLRILIFPNLTIYLITIFPSLLKGNRVTRGIDLTNGFSLIILTYHTSSYKNYALFRVVRL